MGYLQETDTSSIGFPEWEERNKRPENLLKEIITENFQNLRKEMDIQIQKACCCSVAWLCPTLCDPRTAAHQTSLSFTITWSLLKLVSIESVMSSNHLIRCPLLLLPSIFPRVRVFSNELAHWKAGEPLGSQSIGASASVLLMNIQDWFPIGLTGLISFLSNRLLKSLLSAPQLKA